LAILVAAGAGVVFGIFALGGIFLYLDQSKTEREVAGIKLYNLRYPALGLAIFFFFIGPPMLVTGAYYYRWSKVYDVQDGCDANPTRVGDTPQNISAAALYTPVNLTIAYIGDSGASQDTINVYQMIVDEGAELVVSVGDLDYCDDPTTLIRQLDVTLGDIPFLPIIGNHELHLWDDYSDALQNRGDRTYNTDYLQCDGIIYINWWCIYRGIWFAFSSVGTKCGDGYTDYTWHQDQLQQQLELSHEYAAVSDNGFNNGNGNGNNFYLNETWINCVWHKNQQALQLTDKGDETGYGVYDLCSKEGALIVTGHSHVYGRTHGLGDMSTQQVTDSCDTELNGTCIYDLTEGQAIVAVVGTGGYETNVDFNEDSSNAPYWAAKYNQNPGALFCVYNYNGFEDLAYCYFKTTSGDIIDDFYFTQRGENGNSGFGNKK